MHLDPLWSSAKLEASRCTTGAPRDVTPLTMCNTLSGVGGRNDDVFLDGHSVAG